MAQAWSGKPVEWTIKDVGAPLLDSIARGLYSRLEVLREYVQNAVDAYVDFQRITGRAPQNSVQIWVASSSAAVHIFDRGLGMDWTDINTAKAIAVSPKLARSNEFAGFRGLGIWSGLAACDQLVLTTTKVGVASAYKLIIQCKEIVKHLEDPIPIDELLQGRFQIQETQWDSEDHFTHVKLAQVNKERYSELLDITAVTHYAERYLPVPFDPEWKDNNVSYSEIVAKYLASVPWTTTYDLTVNNRPVYRRFPPTDKIKQPESHSVLDDKGREVAVAWLCETSKRGGSKKIDIDSEQGTVRNFAVRVKNFSVGSRGLYSDQDVSDQANLDWFVGEIYVIDTDIKPDTKRTHFQPSVRHDEVIRSIRKFYNSVALRARGWSAQVTIHEACEEVRANISRMEDILADSTQPADHKMTRLRDLWTTIDKNKKVIEEAKTNADRTDTDQDVERALIVRRYLRKPEVKNDIDSALGQIAMMSTKLNHDESGMTEIVKPFVSQSERPKRSRARSATLKGRPVNAHFALDGRVAAGVLPGFEVIASSSPQSVADPENGTEISNMAVDLTTAMEAFAACVAAVIGEQSENYRRIMDRLSDELRRRGIHV